MLIGHGIESFVVNEIELVWSLGSFLNGCQLKCH